MGRAQVISRAAHWRGVGRRCADTRAANRQPGEEHPGTVRPSRAASTYLAKTESPPQHRPWQHQRPYGHPGPPPPSQYNQPQYNQRQYNQPPYGPPSAPPPYPQRPYGAAMPPQADWQRQPTFEAFDGPAQPKPAKRTWSWLLAHPGWAGIGGLVGIVALVLASIQFIGDTGPAPAATNTGDLQRQRHKHRHPTALRPRTCPSHNPLLTRTRRDMGGATPLGTLRTAPSMSIPTPPDYPSEKKNGTLRRLGRVPFRLMPSFFAMGPAVLLTASSGIFDQIAITNVQTNVFDHREISSSPTERSFVECKHGAGLNAGYVVNVTPGRTKPW